MHGIRITRSSEGTTHHLAARALAKLTPLLLPWVVAYGVLPAAAYLTHARWGSSPWAAAALTLTTVTVTLLAAALGTAGALSRWHNTLTALLALGWLTITTIAGPTQVTLDLLLWGGGTLALTWTIRRVIGTDVNLNGRPWGRVAEQLGLDGSRAQITRQDPHRTTTQLQLPPGKTHRDLAGKREEIASHLGVPINGVRVTGDPDDAGRAEMTVVNKDLLRATNPWPGPAAPGASIADAPVPFGTYEDGERALILPINPAERYKLTHLLETGMTGSGKSEIACVAIADLITRADVLVWLADVSGKYWQTYEPLDRGIDWPARDIGTARAMLDVVQKIIPVRARALGAAGMRQWTPEAYTQLGIPFIALVLDEAADLIPDNDEYVALTRKARSVGIWIFTIMQQARYPEMPVEARGNLGAGLCCGVRSAKDAAFTLSADLIERGAAPEVWKDRWPGRAYLDASWVPEDRLIMPLRGDLADPEQYRECALYAEQARPALDPDSRKVAGTTYANRHQPPAGTTASTTAAAAVAPGSYTPADTTELPLMEPAPASTQPAAAAAAAEPTEPAETYPPDPTLQHMLATDPDPDIHVSLDDNLPDDDAVIAFPNTTTLTSEQTYAAVEQRINALADAGHTSFGATDLLDLLEHGAGRADVFAALNQLTAAGRIAPAEIGSYYIRTRELEPV